jgi:protein arginine N-methyltransferase 5
MLTTPITTPNFHSRVLTLLSSHLSILDSSSASATKNQPPAPIIPPFNAVDTPLTPGDTVTQLIGYSSPWIDLCSPDPLIANISRQVLTMEVAYAAFCGVGNIIIQGPRRYSNSSEDTDGVLQYARAIQEALSVGSYVQMSIHMPMYRQEETHVKELIGDLAKMARDEYSPVDGDKEPELYGSWDAWNVIRTVCKYNSRLLVGKRPPIQAFFSFFARFYFL